jgi:hypothetical protein
LRIEDLEFVKALGSIDGDKIHLQRSQKQYRLKTPVTVELSKVLALGTKGLAQYVLQGLTSTRPRLIPFLLDNTSVVKLAERLLRKFSGSTMSLYAYTNSVHQYSQRLGLTPDQIISDARKSESDIQNHQTIVEGMLAELQDANRSSGRRNGFAKQIRSWYSSNGIELKLTNVPRPTVEHDDRAPTQDELTRLIDLADSRGKVIVSFLALGGFREGTLAKLEYRHVKNDLENNISPIHLHIEAGIVKGRYCHYHTFLSTEAIGHVRNYFDSRRKGLPILNGAHTPRPEPKPEEINDYTPVIRDEQLWRDHGKARPIGEKQIYKIIHSLYFKTGLLKPIKKELQSDQHSYELRVHSIRKFFKTQLITKSVPERMVDYWMGHVPDVYTDIESQGVERLREIYARAALTIRPRAQTPPFETLSIIAKGLGLDPEKVLVRDMFAEPHRGVVEGTIASEEERARVVLAALKDYLIQNPATDLESPKFARKVVGPPGFEPGTVRCLLQRL